MRKIRVLIVDDSVTVRHLLWKIFREEKIFDVVGMLSNGREALDRVDELRPDIVTLDIEMPVMGGLDTLSALRRKLPRLPVLVLSTQTQAGALTTLEALSRGAADYVPKPDGLTSVDAGLDYIRTELIPKVKALCVNISGFSAELSKDVAPAIATSAPALPRRSETGPGKYTVLVIGSSMGGPNALAALLPRLGADFPLPVLIAQHMPAMFTRLLAQRLTADGPLPVEEATQGARLKPGHVLIAPGSAHMTVEDNGGLQVHLYPGDIRGVLCKPSVDVLFESAAKVCRDTTLAAVLSGMGSDGLKGATAINHAGGHVLVQDRETAVVWGMPGFVANAGMAHGVLPLNDIGPMLSRKAWLGRVR